MKEVTDKGLPVDGIHRMMTGRGKIDKGRWSINTFNIQRCSVISTSGDVR